MFKMIFALFAVVSLIVDIVMIGDRENYLIDLILCKSFMVFYLLTCECL